MEKVVETSMRIRTKNGFSFQDCSIRKTDFFFNFSLML
jgi:hypothetical protein